MKKNLSIETKKLCNRHYWNGDTAKEVYTYLLLEYCIKDEEKLVVEYLDSIR